ncbi:hypothetical protein G9A89_000894 [Geosiphon pyriformis]|nr:hypothetical protein G9A89_000894 [Geosiphon pyriformis]
MLAAGILFGNVDEEGQIDYNGLDEEVIQSLQHVTENGGEFFEKLLPVSLDFAEVKEQQLEKGSVQATFQNSSIKPEENAIDFFEIDELAAEDPIVLNKYYPQGVHSLINLKRSLTMPILLPSLHSSLEDYGEDYDQSVKSEIKVSELDPDRRVPEKTPVWEKSISFAPETFSIPPQPDITSLYPAFKKDEVLNFTQLFATKVPPRRKIQLRTPKVSSLVRREFAFEDDDRKLYRQLLEQSVNNNDFFSIQTQNNGPFGSKSMKPLCESHQNGNVEIQEEVDLKFNEQKFLANLSNIYNPLMMHSWEDDIIWEDDDNAYSLRNFRKAYQANPKSLELERGSWVNSILWDFSQKTQNSINQNLEFRETHGSIDRSLMEFSLPTFKTKSGTIKKGTLRKNTSKASDYDLLEKYPGGGIPKIPLTKRIKTDRFNISCDTSYDTNRDGRDQRVRQTYGQLVVQHSIPALKLQIPYFKTKLSKAELRAFHRTSIQFPVEQEIRFSKVNSMKKRKMKHKVAEMMRTSKELTLKDNSNFILLEYSEEYPAVMSNTGMGSLLLNYYRKTDQNDTTIPKLDIGEPVILDVADASPFMNFGDVEPGQILPAIFNNLIRAPLFMHSPKDSDFLVIKNTYKGKTKYYIREINNLFVVGQTYPLQEVPGPHSRKVTTTIKNRLQVAALRLMKKNPNHRLKLGKLLKQFQEYSELQIRQRLKEFAELQRNGTNRGFWRSKSKNLPSEEDLRTMLTPEMICLYESMLVGQRHLLDSGYGNVGKSGNGEEEGDESKLSIEEQLAPWITTRNFLNATQNKAMLKLHGDGDPTGIDEGFSFIRVSMKDIFLKVGESAEDKQAEIEKLPKSAHKYSVAEQQQRYQEEIDRIWNAQYNSLSNKQEIFDESGNVQESKEKHYKESRNNNELHQAELDEDHTYSSASSPSMFSSGDLDDNYSVDGSMGSRASYAYGSHRNRRLTITRKIRMSSGEELFQVEDVIDPAVINAYMRHRHMIEEQTTSADKLEPTNDEEKNKRLKKRIQDQLAKLKRNQERRLQRMAARQAETSIEGSTSNPKDKKPEPIRRCGNCGELGHMKTNRKCKKFKEMNPDKQSELFSSSTSQDPPFEQEPIIKMEGTKISISKAVVEKVTEASLAQGNKSSSEKRKRKETEQEHFRDYVRPHVKSYGHGRRRPDVELSNVLQRICYALFAMDEAVPFMKPVKNAPQYHEIIQHPMDLGTIKENCKNFRYHTASEFLRDIQLMVDNCHQYNGKDTLTIWADKIRNKALELINEKMSDIAPLEQAILEEKMEISPTKQSSLHSLDG